MNPSKSITKKPA